jgi:hypothetical protein
MGLAKISGAAGVETCAAAGCEVVRSDVRGGTLSPITNAIRTAKPNPVNSRTRVIV